MSEEALKKQKVDDFSDTGLMHKKLAKICIRNNLEVGIRSKISHVVNEVKKEFPKCKDCMYIEINEQQDCSDCKLDLGFDQFCSKNLWFKKWFG